MNTRVRIIVAHFGGKLSESFQLFLKSCANNPEFEWLMLTDINMSAFVLPTNFSISKVSLIDVKERAQQKFGMKVSLESPYKLCDYKVAYGYLFSDFLVGYDFWGVCDYDVIFGNLSKFITDSVLMMYDKIYTLGHFFLVRNNKECNEAFMYESRNTNSYKAVYTTPLACFFDENMYGINKKMEQLGLRIFKKVQYIDRSIIHNRFRSVSKQELKGVFQSLHFFESIPLNQRLQLFSWDGGVFRNYYEKGKIVKQEYAYIHFRGNIEVRSNDHNCPTIVIARCGFVPCSEIKYETILELNPPCSRAFELFEQLNKNRELFITAVTRDGTFNWKLFFLRLPGIGRLLPKIKKLLLNLF